MDDDRRGRRRAQRSRFSRTGIHGRTLMRYYIGAGAFALAARHGRSAWGGRRIRRGIGPCDRDRGQPRSLAGAKVRLATRITQLPPKRSAVGTGILAAALAPSCPRTGTAELVASVAGRAHALLPATTPADEQAIAFHGLLPPQGWMSRPRRRTLRLGLVVVRPTHRRPSMPVGGLHPVPAGLPEPPRTTRSIGTSSTMLMHRWEPEPLVSGGFRPSLTHWAYGRHPRAVPLDDYA
jgi:hypothetical protein